MWRGSVLQAELVEQRELTEDAFGGIGGGGWVGHGAVLDAALTMMGRGKDAKGRPPGPGSAPLVDSRAAPQSPSKQVLTPNTTTRPTKRNNQKTLQLEGTVSRLVHPSISFLIGATQAPIRRVNINSKKIPEDGRFRRLINTLPVVGPDFAREVTKRAKRSRTWAMLPPSTMLK